MLQEIHARGAEVGSQLQLPGQGRLRLHESREPHGVGVAIGLRVQVLLAQVGVAVGVLAEDESGRLLFELRRREIEPRGNAAARTGRERGIQLALVETRLVTPAAVVRIQRLYPQADGLGRVRRDQAAARVLVRAQAEPQLPGR